VFGGRTLYLRVKALQAAVVFGIKVRVVLGGDVSTRRKQV